MADITKLGADDNPNLSEGQLLNAQEQQDTQAENQESVDELVADKPDSVDESKGIKETDWEKSAKYFQSEKDKVAAENAELKQQIQQMTKQQQEVQQVNEEEAIKPPDDFDPWEAYNDPNSESYAFRQQMEQMNIAKAVESSQKQLEEKMKVKDKLQEFDNELTKEGLSAEDKELFYKFANTPLSQMGTDKLVNMWRAVDNRVNTPQNASGPREFDKIRKQQAEPTPAGVLQGEQPPAVNESDETWNRIVNATNRTRIV